MAKQFAAVYVHESGLGPHQPFTVRTYGPLTNPNVLLHRVLIEKREMIYIWRGPVERSGGRTTYFDTRLEIIASTDRTPAMKWADLWTYEHQCYTDRETYGVLEPVKLIVTGVDFETDQMVHLYIEDILALETMYGDDWWKRDGFPPTH